MKKYSLLFVVCFLFTMAIAGCGMEEGMPLSEEELAMMEETGEGAVLDETVINEEGEMDATKAISTTAIIKPPVNFGYAYSEKFYEGSVHVSLDRIDVSEPDEFSVGKLYASNTDFGYDRCPIRVFNLDGSLIEGMDYEELLPTDEWGNEWDACGESGVRDIAVDNTGRYLYILRHSLHRLDLSTGEYVEFAEDLDLFLSDPREIDTDSSGNVYVSVVTDSDEVVIKITPSGEKAPITSAYFSNRPRGTRLRGYGIAIDKTNNYVYVAIDGKVAKYSAGRGAYISTIGRGGAGSAESFHDLGAIATDSTGLLYVVEHNLGDSGASPDDDIIVIRKYSSTTGSYVSQLDVSVRVDGWPYDLVFNGNSNMFLSSGSDGIYQFNRVIMPR